MDIPTMSEWIRRYESIKALRVFWETSGFDPALRNMIFPAGSPLRVAWDQTYLDEETALAAGYLAVWPD